jgi:DNA-binding transcriptional regulator YhcF (GntR family)
MGLTMGDPRPTYLQVADAIRQDISSGRLRPSEKLPSVRELAERYGLAPATVQSALRSLRERGWIYSQSTRGYFVSASPPESTEAEPHSSEYMSIMAKVSAIASAVDELYERVTVLEKSHRYRAKGNASDPVEDLQRQVAALQVQLMDLYSRTGQPYPHESIGQRDARREQPG